MEEINAWGAYESAATQNARSLGQSTRSRLPFAKKNRPVESEDDKAAAISTHSLFLGMDGFPDLEQTNEGKEGVEKALNTEDVIDAEKQKEWFEIRDLAHDVFEVYFKTDDSSVDIGKMKAMNHKFHNYVLGTMPWLPRWIKKMSLPSFMKEILLFVEASFRGMAQVYFQNNPLSGMLILAAIFVQSSRVAVHGMIAVIASNLAGVLMGFDKSFLSSGLLGYNSFLVGLALATFDSPEKNTGYSWQRVVETIVFAYFSSILFVMLGKLLGPYKTPPFTFPFNIATLTLLLAMGDLNAGGIDAIIDDGSITVRAFFAGSIRGVGQVFLANNIVSGVIVLIAIAVCSRISALAAFVGSAVGAGVAVLTGKSADVIENGMFGFNPSLTFTAMMMFYVPSVGSFGFGIFASIITVFVQLALATAMGPSGLPFMTLPFCFAALSYIAIQGTTSSVISVPLSSMTTPEDHLKRVRRLSEGFELLYGAIKSSSYTGKTMMLASISGRKDKNMTSILKEYDEEVNGFNGRGLFSKLQEQFRGDNANEGSKISKMASFRMSFAMKNSSFEEEEKETYARMFNHIDTSGKYTVVMPQFKEFLLSVGLNDKVGLDFACKSFELMDFDGSGDIDLDKFIAFAKISRHMPAIRRMIVKFFDFVDVNGDRSVEVKELDSARSYLGLPALSKRDHDRLEAFCNNDGYLEFDVFVNFVTVFKLKSIIRVFQQKRNNGESLDKSIHSALTGT